MKTGSSTAIPVDVVHVLLGARNRCCDTGSLEKIADKGRYRLRHLNDKTDARPEPRRLPRRAGVQTLKNLVPCDSWNQEGRCCFSQGAECVQNVFCVRGARTMHCGRWAFDCRGSQPDCGARTALLSRAEGRIGFFDGRRTCGTAFELHAKVIRGSQRLHESSTVCCGMLRTSGETHEPSMRGPGTRCRAAREWPVAAASSMTALRPARPR